MKCVVSKYDLYQEQLLNIVDGISALVLLGFLLWRLIGTRPLEPLTSLTLMFFFGAWIVGGAAFELIVFPGEIVSRYRRQEARSTSNAPIYWMRLTICVEQRFVLVMRHRSLQYARQQPIIIPALSNPIVRNNLTRIVNLANANKCQYLLWDGADITIPGVFDVVYKQGSIKNCFHTLIGRYFNPIRCLTISAIRTTGRVPP